MKKRLLGIPGSEGSELEGEDFSLKYISPLQSIKKIGIAMALIAGITILVIKRRQQRRFSFEQVLIKRIAMGVNR